MRIGSQRLPRIIAVDIGLVVDVLDHDRARASQITCTLDEFIFHSILRSIQLAGSCGRPVNCRRIQECSSSTCSCDPRELAKASSKKKCLFQIATTRAKTTVRMLAPPTYVREVTLKAEEETVDAAEEVEGAVDDARVKESDAEAEAGGGPGAGGRSRYGPRSTLSERRIHRGKETHADAEPDDAEPLALALADPVDDAEADELTGSALRSQRGRKYPSELCETNKGKTAKRTLQGSEDVCQEMLMGPVEVTVSVGLPIDWLATWERKLRLISFKDYGIHLRFRHRF
ncbi:hypothetical protein EDD85DRAFT_940048 [Armillaria nabsnona]|nr:hypothetical protein EDD85DRAFT_940048 [Armillaria nabsnona]